MQPNLQPETESQESPSACLAVLAIITTIIAGAATAAIGGLWLGIFMKAFRCVYP